MENTSIQQNLYWQLFQVAISTKHELMTTAEKYKLSVMQLYTLCLLDNKTSIPMNSLSSTLHCDASNVTGIVDRLLGQNYIVRAENPEDRREKMIKLTAKGARLCAKISTEINRTPPINVSQLSEKQKQQLSQILNDILTSKTSPKK
ncbi:MAG: MarR family winged helix-turn-helix transcriptional regulator [Candidatus Levyibacteriota bacterium]